MRLGEASAPLQATVTNGATFVYTIDKFELTDPSFVLLSNTCSGAVLAPQQTCSFAVVFKPQTVGHAEAYVSMQLNTFCGFRRDYFPCSYKSPGPGIGQSSNFTVEDLLGGLRRVRWTLDSLSDGPGRGNSVVFEGAGVG
ncbi:MAG TPA: hypothetical protein VGE11_22485 [Pseudonocardia sp.]